MPKLLFILLLFIAQTSFAQTQITWRTLDDVTFEDKYIEDINSYYYYPTFGETVSALEGKEVYIEGHMLVIDRTEGIYILSRYPYASCFFCGSGGPESIVEMKLKPGHPKFKMDQRVTMIGTLVLNPDDIYQCNYILDNARVYEK